MLDERVQVASSCGLRHGVLSVLRRKSIRRQSVWREASG
ncbi:hypothetical protein G155_00209 [Mycobacterium sp. VKM Ac-1817D]|nr:hypothetical protein G155_00209 [Mycobacterium sp. VKM Ac-1817D]